MQQEQRQPLEWQLCTAAGKGDKDAVAHLLHQGVPGSAARQARTALMEAAARGHVEIIALLLDHEADVHARDEQGQTALIRAAMYGCRGCITSLLAYGADLHAQDHHKMSALDYAAMYGRIATVEMLLERGGVISSRSIHYAREHRHQRVVEILEQHLPSARAE